MKRNAYRCHAAVLALGAAALLSVTVGCAGQLELEPEFAARANELPMDVPMGFLPPDRLTIGAYQVTDTKTTQAAQAQLSLGPVDAQIGGNWKLSASFQGPATGKIACVGPSKFWKRSDKPVRITVGRATLGCQLLVDDDEWTFLFDVELNQSGPEVPEWVSVMDEALHGPREKSDPRDWDALVVNDDGRAFSVEWAHQTVRAGNVGGYYVFVDGVIVGAVDVSSLGAPRAHLGQDVPADLKHAVIASMATAYLLMSVIPPPQQTTSFGRR